MPSTPKAATSFGRPAAIRWSDRLDVRMAALHGLLLTAALGMALGIAWFAMRGTLERNLANRAKERARIIERGLGLRPWEPGMPAREASSPEDRIRHLIVLRTPSLVRATLRDAAGAVVVDMVYDSLYPPAVLTERNRRMPYRETFVRRLDDGSTLTQEMRHDIPGELAETTRILLLVFVVFVPFATLLAWYISRRGMMRLRRITDAATGFSGDGASLSGLPLSRRQDEVDALAATFNAMADRVQRTIVEHRRITDHLAHELRSPITCMRASAELALARSPHPDHAALAAETVENCDRLLALVNALLEIAEAGAGAPVRDPRPLDAEALLRGAQELFEPLAVAKGLAVEVATVGDLGIVGDAAALQRCLSNLVDNAIKYTPAGGEVLLIGTREGAQVHLSVRNPAPDFDPMDLPRLGDRFYRGENHRRADGAGLGLALARAIAQAHGGQLHFLYSEGWFTAEWMMPAAQ